MEDRALNRRTFLTRASAYGGSVALTLRTGRAFAQEPFPSGPLAIIVPFGVGGGTDIWMRVIGVALATRRSLHTPVSIRNVPGAASLRGAGVGFHAEPDGHTLTAFNPPSTPWAWVLHRPPFDLTAFRGITVYVREPGIMVTHPDSPIRDFPQLVAAYDSGALSVIASQQAGTIWHIAATLMKRRTGLNWQRYVSYKGTGDIIAAVIRREVAIGIVTASSALSHVQGGTLRPISRVGASERLASFPDVATMNEYGKDPLSVCVLRRSVFAPPGIAEDRRHRLESAFIAAQDHPIVLAQYQSLSLAPARGTGAEAEHAIADAIAVAKEIDLASLAG